MSKRVKNILRVIVFIAVFSISVIVFSDYITTQSAEGKIFTNTEETPVNKVGVVLGTSKYISDGRRNLFYYYRMEAIKELYNKGKIEYILVSGDNATPEYNETDTMKRDLLEAGIPEEKIYGDYAGFRTLDSVVRAKDIFGQSQYTIVSQRFHLERALFLAGNNNISAIGYAAQDVPVSMSPRVWIRERFARVKMVFDIALGVKPKFGGEQIIIGEEI